MGTKKSKIKTIGKYLGLALTIGAAFGMVNQGIKWYSDRQNNYVSQVIEDAQHKAQVVKSANDIDSLKTLTAQQTILLNRVDAKTTTIIQMLQSDKDIDSATASNSQNQMTYRNSQ